MSFSRFFILEGSWGRDDSNPIPDDVFNELETHGVGPSLDPTRHSSLPGFTTGTPLKCHCTPRSIWRSPLDVWSGSPVPALIPLVFRFVNLPAERSAWYASCGRRKVRGRRSSKSGPMAFLLKTHFCTVRNFCAQICHPCARCFGPSIAFS